MVREMKIFWGKMGGLGRLGGLGGLGGETHWHLWDRWDKWEQKKLPLVRQLNFLLYTNYLIIHHLHQSTLKTL